MTRPLTPPERQRLRTPANLWRALIPLLAVIGLLVLFALPRGGRSNGVHVIDVAAPIAAARTQAGFELVAPVGLPPKWRPTNTQFLPASASNGASFRIGYVSPNGQYAEFIESNVPTTLASEYAPLTTDKPVSVDGATWDGFRRADGRRLIRHATATGVTVVVTGSASEQELVQLAASLH